MKTREIGPRGGVPSAPFWICLSLLECVLFTKAENRSSTLDLQDLAELLNVKNSIA